MDVLPLVRVNIQYFLHVLIPHYNPLDCTPILGSACVYMSVGVYGNPNLVHYAASDTTGIVMKKNR